MKIADIRKFEPCYDPSKWEADENRNFTIMDVLEHPDIEPKDKIWVATREGILPDDILRKFAIFCARSCKTDIKEITEYIDATERFYAGKATESELRAADWAAYWAADRVADRVFIAKLIELMPIKEGGE